ncbi:helix-turn-helix domain-containing protein [Jiangella sp. DSM 45060]|uniref:helix-turn-helix domain-containing protein n=1 Tax=Jiangella sp. DSM 45060 TaxID=1798224 RepID=UPI0018D28627|nr:helix-turn-helix domain-containing protein [Jiangella sp. DSM 45060]
MYSERPSTIAHAVVWSSRVTTDEEHRVLPDGCLDLLWSGGRLMVAGPDTIAHLASWRAGTPFVGLRLGAGVGPRVLGLPAHELRDQRVPLDALWPGAEVRRLAERLAEVAEAAEPAAADGMGGAADGTAEAADPGALLDAGRRSGNAPPPDPGALTDAAVRFTDRSPAGPGRRPETGRRPGKASPPDPDALLAAGARLGAAAPANPGAPLAAGARPGPAAPANPGAPPAAGARLGPAAPANPGAPLAADARLGPAAPANPGALLEAVAVARLREAAPADPVVERVACLLGHGANVGDVAREVGLSARQLHRRSLDAFGYGPKTLSRILRLHRALELGRSGAPAADAAYAAGYADQAHLSREARSLAGVTLTTLVA